MVDDNREVKTLAQIEQEAIEAAVLRNGGNKKLAARELGIAFKTVYNKLNSYELRRLSNGDD